MKELEMLAEAIEEEAAVEDTSAAPTLESVAAELATISQTLSQIVGEMKAAATPDPEEADDEPASDPEPEAEPEKEDEEDE